MLLNEDFMTLAAVGLCVIPVLMVFVAIFACELRIQAKNDDE